MNNSQNTLILEETKKLLIEIDDLKEQLQHEKQQHKHWQDLAMIFHDALWDELKQSQKVGVR